MRLIQLLQCESCTNPEFYQALASFVNDLIATHALPDTLLHSSDAGISMLTSIWTHKAFNSPLKPDNLPLSAFPGLETVPDCDVLSATQLAHVPQLGAIRHIIGWIPWFFVALCPSNTNNTKPMILPALNYALIHLFDGFESFCEVSPHARELLFRIGLNLLAMFSTSTQPLLFPFPWKACTTQRVLDIITHYLAENATDDLLLDVLKKLVSHDIAWTDAIWTGSMNGLDMMECLPNDTDPSLSPVPAILLDANVLVSACQWPLDFIMHIVLACAQVLLSPPLSTIWQAPTHAPVVDAHFQRFIAYGDILGAIFDNVIFCTPKTAQIVLKDDSFLNSVPGLLTSVHPTLAHNLGGWLEQVFDASSQFQTRRSLFAHSACLENASIKLLDQFADLNLRSKIYVMSMSRHVSWARNALTITMTTSMTVAVTKYYSSFYWVGLCIGKHPNCPDDDFACFEATQAQTHDAVLQFLTYLQRGSISWTSDISGSNKFAFSQLLMAFTKWARVKDPGISDMIFKLTDLAWTVAKQYGIPLDTATLTALDIIANDTRRKKSSFTTQQLDILKAHASSNSILKTSTTDTRIPSQTTLHNTKRKPASPTKPLAISTAPASNVQTQFINAHHTSSTGHTFTSQISNTPQISNTHANAAQNNPNNLRNFGYEISPAILRLKNDTAELRAHKHLTSNATISKPYPYAGAANKVKSREEILAMESEKMQSLEKDRAARAAQARQAMAASMAARSSSANIPRVKVQVQSISFPDKFGKGSRLFTNGQSLLKNKHAALPSPETFERAVVQWKYSSTRDTPESNFSTSEEYDAYCPVPDCFQSVRDYYDCFRPLAMLEVWSELQRSKSGRETDPVTVEVCDVAFTSYMMDVKVLLPSNKLRDAGIIDLDIVHVFDQSGNLSALGKVHSLLFNRQNVEVRIFLSLKAQVRPQTKIYAKRLFSVVTAYRQYVALSAIPKIPLIDKLLNKHTSAHPVIPPTQLVNVCKTHGLNNSQAHAVLVASQLEGFTLIQGPPGTGKTKTILALIAAILCKEPRVLVCAPSNAALDEIVRRLLRGVPHHQTGHTYVPNVVRVGNPSSIHPDARVVSLDDLIDEDIQTNGDSTWRKLIEERAQIITEKNMLEQHRNQALDAMDMALANILDMQLKVLYIRRRTLLAKLDTHRQLRTDVSRSLEVMRGNARTQVLTRAQVVCSTITSAGQDVFLKSKCLFKVVIIDEAAQAIEMAALIPIQYGATQCILVGDPNQLPPTVISRKAQQFNFNQSLFVRLQKMHPDSVLLLNTQYRMHPAISRFPNQMFYKGQLLNGLSASDCVSEWHTHKSGHFPPLAFFEVSGQQVRSKTTQSLSNKEEVDMVMYLIDTLIRQHPNVNFCGRIGVISMYNDQCKSIKNRITQLYGQMALEFIDVNTCDGYQGQEKDVIIVSTVRGRSDESIGFLSDVRRINVALTRAKFTLLVVGSSQVLCKDPNWSQLIQHVQEMNQFIRIPNIPHLLKGKCPPNLQPVGYEETSKFTAAEDR